MQRYAETGPEEGSFETETVDLIGPAEDIEVSTENITGEQEDYRRTLHIIKETMICHYDETTDVHDSVLTLVDTAADAAATDSELAATLEDAAFTLLAAADMVRHAHTTHADATGTRQ